MRLTPELFPTHNAIKQQYRDYLNSKKLEIITIGTPHKGP
jgi:hypothetical protein